MMKEIPLYFKLAAIVCLNFLFHASGFGVPSAMDFHHFFSSLDSLHQLNPDFPESPSLSPDVTLSLTNLVDSQNVIDIRSFYETIKEATVTKRVDNALAGIIAESAAGATGGLISRTLIEGRNNDSIETKMKTTGAFFGARTATEGVSRVLGVPRPLSLLFAAIVASFISSYVKAESRIADNQTTEIRLSSPKASYYFVDGEIIMNLDTQRPSKWTGYLCGDGELLVNMDSPPSLQTVSGSPYSSIDSIIDSGKQDNSMLFPEIAGDICKWMVYDCLVVNSGYFTQSTSWSPHYTLVLHIIFGGIASVSGKYLRDLTPSKDNFITTRDTKFRPSHYSKAAIEGGVLFGTYKATLSLLHSIVPENWNREFLFNSALETLEDLIP